MSTDAAVKRCRERIHQTQSKKLDRFTSCREAIEETRTFSINPPSYRGGVKIAIRKSLGARQIVRCRGGVKIVFKTSFSRREKHRYECNQAYNSINDPNTILSSQNHLSIIILSTWIPETHTHTKQV